MRRSAYWFCVLVAALTTEPSASAQVQVPPDARVVTGSEPSDLSAILSPDLQLLSVDEQGIVKSACELDRSVSGPSKYYACLRNQFEAVRTGAGLPHLSSVTPDERSMIESACRVHKSVSGPATYYSCLRSQLAALGRDSATPRADASGATGSGQASGNLPAKSRPISPVARRPTSDGASTGSDRATWLIILFLVALIGWPITHKVLKQLRTKPCSRCGDATTNATGACSACGRKEQDERHRQSREAAESRAREYAARRKYAEEERLRQLRTMEQLHALSGTEVETLVGSLFEKLGCSVDRSTDDGIDLFLEADGARLAVQCRCWRNDIDSPTLRDFLGAMLHAGVAHGFVITTARFSESASAFARGKAMTLINGPLLLRWLDGKHSPTVRGHSGKSEGATSGWPRKPVQDPYVVLGLSRGASPEEIRRAYYALIAQYHPDKVAQLGPELRDLASEKSKEINRAYSQLANRSA